MSAKSLGTLALVLMVLVAIAWLQSRRGGQPVGDDVVTVGSPVLVDVDINEIRSVTIQRGEEKTRIGLHEDHWVVESLYDYPVDFQKFAGFLRKMSGLDVGQVVPDGVDFLDEFGLVVGSATEAPTVIGLAGGSGDELVRLSLGAERSGRPDPNGFGGFPSGRYLRVGEGPVLLVDEVFADVRATGSDWILKELLRVQPADVRALTVSLSNETYTVQVLGDNQFEVEGCAEDEEVDTSVCARVGRALQNVRCTGIVDPELADEELGFDAPASLKVQAKDGVTYEVFLGAMSENGQSRFARFAVGVEAPPEPTREQAEELVKSREAEVVPEGEDVAPQAEGDRVAKIDSELGQLLSDHTARVEALENKVAELNAVLEGWTYELPSYSADSMCLPRSQVVKKKPEADPQPSEAGAVGELVPGAAAGPEEATRSEPPPVPVASVGGSVSE